MQLHKIAFDQTHSFSNFFLDYINGHETLRKFYGRFPSLAAFGEQLQEKAHSYPAHHRKVLTSTLEKQYQGADISQAAKRSLETLSQPTTFTVTTGHQLNLFTGPLYFIYKIMTVINTCKQLKQQYPAYDFVPVYWMASEDHDFEEIKYFWLHGKKYEWNTSQTGAVGRFLTKDMKALLQEVPGEISIFKKAYSDHPTLAAAVRNYVNELFGNEGLLVLDADDRALKELFREVITADVLHQAPCKTVEETNRQLTSAGYHPQVNPRAINFFYLDKDLRNRIEYDGDSFKVLDTTLSFSRPEIEKMIAQEPEKFSPNVILRPLYQEMILPNLAYVGGPAELVYWLELKAMFRLFTIPFPILLPRNFALVLDKPTHRKFLKTGLAWKDLFEEKNFLFNHWVINNTSHNLSLGKEIKSTAALFEEIQQRAERIDSTLKPFVGAEAKRAKDSLEKIEKKMLRAEKRLHDDKLRQIEAVKEILFPNGSLQERRDNFLNFYQQDPRLIQQLLGLFDPFDFRFNVICDHE